jgi:thymidine phosphorylase
VLEREGGCVVWGGGMSLSPADEILARMGRELDMDAEGQLVASILSKKIAAGSTHVVIDIPVGPTAKIRTAETAHGLIDRLARVGRTFGIEVECLLTDGLQPVGRGIGPALEARDVLAVLRGRPGAPQDLRERALSIAGAVLELAGKAATGGGSGAARAALDDGRAWAKFQRICEAQGGLRSPPTARLKRDWLAPHAGCLVHINSRKLAKIAKLAGAPDRKAAGVVCHVRLGDAVVAGQPLITVHSEAAGELDYALDYAAANPDAFGVEL